MKPILAISLGDPAGIGPEIAAASLEEAVAHGRPILFGHWPTFQRALLARPWRIGISLVDRPLAPPPEGEIAFVHCGPLGPAIEEPGRPAAVSQLEALDQAIGAVIAGRCDALVTAPISKAAVAEIRPGFIGHTEHLADCAGVSRNEVTMVFASQALAVGLVSAHVPLREVASSLTRPRLERTVRHLALLLSRLRPGLRPRIAVCGLNPHAGEGGILGFEEQSLLSPLCQELRRTGELEIEGPLPADSVFRNALAGRFDGVVAMYHDQAMIPLKLSGIGQTVNVTMGLPFVRTSPDHGVAHDLARRGSADPAGMRLAIEMAARLARAGAGKDWKDHGG